MPRLIKSNTASLILRVKLIDDGGTPIVDREHDDADLVIRYRRPSDTAWQTVSKSLGVAGVYSAGGWIGIGTGWHELGLPNAAIVPGQRTEIEIKYGANQPQADSIDAVLETDSVAFASSVTTALITAIRPWVIDANLPAIPDTGTFTITAKDDYDDNADIDPIGPIRITSTLDLLRVSNPPRLRFGATNRLGSRLGAVKFIGRAYAVAVANEDDMFDVFIELTKTELNRAPGTYAWDVEAVFPGGDVQTLFKGLLNLEASKGDNEERDPLNP